MKSLLMTYTPSKIAAQVFSKNIYWGRTDSFGFGGGVALWEELILLESQEILGKLLIAMFNKFMD